MLQLQQELNIEKLSKGRIHGKASRCSKLNYGQYGLKALQPERVIGKQIEAARVALTRYMKRTGKVWTRVFQTFLFQKSQLRLEWEKVKVPQSTTRVELNQVELFLKLMVYQKKLQERHFIKHQQNYQLKLNLLKDKMKSKKEDKKLTKDQATKKIMSLKKDLFNIRFKKINGQVENPAQYNEIKKSIARLYTKFKRQNDKKNFTRFSY